MDYALFSKKSAFGQFIINEDNELFNQVREYNPETIQTALDEGCKFAHRFSWKEDDYGQFYFEYQTSEIIK